ncbi:MAG: anhydro-N-acetylmuramic acid kinase [Methylovirgula sp.]|uniref:anhydro-N-acetylmuramic acid kinase n=1 Tax=Methylovirgula sp. TaxID=1978224 RepID=UPI00307622D1
MIRALGLMSGTSLDGIDVAVIATDGAADVMPGPARSFAYSDDDRALLRAALAAAEGLPADPATRAARPGVLSEAEARVTLRHAEAVRDFLAAESIDPASIDVIGFHGQTVIHRPDAHFTVQIGDGAALARETGRPVAFDFRAADVAAGGQGAPLVPIYHSALVKAAGFDEAVVVVNVGGVANLTYVDDGPPIAFDTGPGNALIDDMMFSRAGEKMDIGGTTAAEGKIDFTALAEMLAHPYFALPPPKSLDRNAFSSSRVANLPLPDAVATLTALTAHSIVRGIDLLPKEPKLVVLSGGGVHNLTLRWQLMQLLPCGLVTADRLGWSADAMEAQAFAYLAVRRLKNLPITFPTTTGVAQPLEGGRLLIA